MDPVRNRGLAARIVGLSVDLAVEHTRALLAAGADFVFVAAATDGPAAVAPADYLEFTIPGLKRIVEGAGRHGAPVAFHPHGPLTAPRFQPLVEAALECGIAGFQFGEACDLGLAKRLWGGPTSVLGGPDAGEALIPGPVERVRGATRDVLSQAGAGGGFVLMASCSLHRGVPPEHLDAMVETVEKHHPGQQGAQDG